jgi:hypothetical protein
MAGNSGFSPMVPRIGTLNEGFAKIETSTQLGRGQGFYSPIGSGPQALSATPGSDNVPKMEPRTPKTAGPKRKISKLQASKTTRSNRKGLTVIEKSDIRCIVGECFISCPSIKQYKKHLKTVHAVSTSHTSDKIVDCQVPGCLKKLREGSMMRHITQTHLKASHVVCDICHARFSRVDSLRSHESKHAESTSKHNVGCDDGLLETRQILDEFVWTSVN